MPEDEPKQSNNIGRYAWISVLVIFMLGFAVFIVKTFIDDHNRNSNAADTVSREKIAEQFAPTSDLNSEGSDDNVAPPIDDIRGPQGSEENKPQVLGSSLNASQPSSAPTFKPYRNNAFGINTMVPADAQIAITDNKITVNSPTGIFWTLTKYDNTEETLESLETQLSSSPSVTSLARTFWGDIPALVFTSPNLQGATGYAFITNGHLYYLVGNFATPESWQGFTFF